MPLHDFQLMRVAFDKNDKTSFDEKLSVSACTFLFFPEMGWYLFWILIFVVVSQSILHYILWCTVDENLSNARDDGLVMKLEAVMVCHGGRTDLPPMLPPGLFSQTLHHA